jgi:uncharacterized protein YcbK (DUF882 family)
MGDVSKNFSRREFACKCGCGFNAVDVDLLIGLQKLRDIAGESIRINSACRCEAHNKKVGGAAKSQHKFAKAADIVISGKAPGEMAALAEKVAEFQKGAIIVYGKDGFIHVDVRGVMYREVRP